MRLLVCGDCNRHVRDSEATCPFCGADTAHAATSGDPRARGARDRPLLLFGVGAVVVGVAAACSTSKPESGFVNDAADGAAQQQPGSGAAFYGCPSDEGGICPGPPRDAGDTASKRDAGFDASDNVDAAGESGDAADEAGDAASD